MTIEGTLIKPKTSRDAVIKTDHNHRTKTDNITSILLFRRQSNHKTKQASIAKGLITLPEKVKLVLIAWKSGISVMSAASWDQVIWIKQVYDSISPRRQQLQEKPKNKNKSVVTPRSVFIETKIRWRKIEAVCDCGASVSFLRNDIYNELKQTHKLDLKPRLGWFQAADQLHIEVQGVDRVPVIIGPKSYEHELCVLDKPRADGFLGLNFPETNKC